ncbi:signal sequence receptor alpha chain [Ceratobasidium sp. AG-Ba]|nr:signal sequence receptor alpha chain [Ceratobasidium sp. AG-Ba]
MRFFQTFSQVALLASAVYASIVPVPEPKLDISASFTDDNPFGQVVNGQRTKLIVKILNQGTANLTLEDIAGSFHDADTGKTLRNITASKFNMPIIEGMNLTFPYFVTSELRPKDTKLHVWANIKDANENRFRMTAFDSVVAVVEPAKSIFDFQIQKGRTGAVPAAVAAEVPLPATPGGAARYEEEWIPSHHLQGAGKARKSKGDALSSGDESTGARKRKVSGKR